LSWDVVNLSLNGLTYLKLRMEPSSNKYNMAVKINWEK